jgi:MshEN domain
MLDGHLKELVDNVRGSLIPQFSDLRRVPARYRQVLPWPIMKRYQCLVVGSEPGILTVAITVRHNTSMLEALQKFTGQAIFPVLIDPGRMRLLLLRMERCYQRESSFSSRPGRCPGNTHSYQWALLRLHLALFVMVRSSQKDTLS